jgi:hypothetical protein
MSFADDVARITRAWNRALAAARIGLALTPAILVAGAAILVARLFGQGRAETAWIPAVAVLVAVVIGVTRARRRPVKPDQIAVMLDLRGGGDGRWLQVWEQGSAPPGPVPRSEPRPDFRRVAIGLMPALLFCALAVLVPVRPLFAADPLKQDPVSALRLDELKELARRLEEAVILEEEFRAEIAQRLESLAEPGSEGGPEGEALREALDRVEEKLERRAEEAASALDAAQRDLTQTAGEYAAAQREAAAATESATDGAAEALRAQAEAAARLALHENLARMQSAGALMRLPEGWENLPLATQFEQLGELTAEQLARLAQQGLLDPSQLARWDPVAKPTPPREPCKQCREGDPAG